MSIQQPRLDGVFGDADYVVGITKRLGELYETGGDRERAFAHCFKSVELCEDADPELQPSVVDVKRRLTHLREAKRH